MNSEQASSQFIDLDANRRLSAWEECALTTMPPRPILWAKISNWSHNFWSDDFGLDEQNWRVGRKVARISYCSFRTFAWLKRISAQLGGGATAPLPPPPTLISITQLPIKVHRYTKILGKFQTWSLSYLLWSCNWEGERERALNHHSISLLINIFWANFYPFVKNLFLLSPAINI